MLSTLAADDHASSSSSLNVDDSSSTDDHIEDLRMQFRNELLTSFRVAMTDSKYGKMCTSSSRDNQTQEVDEGFTATEKEERRSTKQVLNSLRLFGK